MSHDGRDARLRVLLVTRLLTLMAATSVALLVAATLGRKARELEALDARCHDFLPTSFCQHEDPVEREYSWMEREFADDSEVVGMPTTFRMEWPKGLPDDLLDLRTGPGWYVEFAPTSRN